MWSAAHCQLQTLVSNHFTIVNIIAITKPHPYNIRPFLLTSRHAQRNRLLPQSSIFDTPSKPVSPSSVPKSSTTRVAMHLRGTHDL